MLGRTQKMVFSGVGIQMASQKGKSGRKRAARAPVIEAEATEITEDDVTAEDADAQRASQGEAATPDTRDTEAAKDEAEDVSVEEMSDGETALPPKKSGSHPWMKSGAVLALLAAVGLGGAWLYRDYGSKYFPVPATQEQKAALEAMTGRISMLETGAKAASERETQLRAEIAALRTSIGALDLDAAMQAAKTAGAKAGSAEQTAKTAASAAEAAGKTAAQASEGLQAANQAIAEVKAAIADAANAMPDANGDANEALKAAQMQISNLNLKVDDAIKRLTEEAKSASGNSSEVAALTETVSILQSGLKQLSEAQTKTMAAGAESAALAGALTTLREKLATGAPYSEPLSIIAKDLPDDPALKVLTSAASTGVASATSLITAFGGVQSQLNAASSKAAEKPAEQPPAGLFARIQNRLGQIVKIRPAGSTDWQGIATRMAGEAKRGDLAAMVRHLDGVSAPPPAVLGAWLGQARARLAADAAFGELSVNVMARAAASGKTGG